MINEIKKDAGSRMEKSIDSLRHELAKLRTGRAHVSLLDHVHVEFYGNEVPLSQAASITVGDPRTLVVQPWDKTMVGPIEKAIMSSDLGLNPATAGTVIRVPLPPLTEQRRREMGKVVRHEGESAKVAVRNIRRDALADLKMLQKEKEISEDEERRAADDVQKLTDRFVDEIDKLVEAKEAELLEI
ncbi:ribosome recycling factor [Plasticicumulans acidivorans]|uniref:Ribosome-recycling factor n=1 Tax=Plasticicumulans acidivorans TaxID=886464 RepID=A0A317MXI3_9GAMM|nr:ribosome recycling factor [Plasticicumulans acidivorans]PWV63521.1 ribosome recycling factor [Plasticicumulans acidivorans]